MNGFIKLNIPLVDVNGNPTGQNKPVGFKFGLYVLAHIQQDLDTDIAGLRAVINKNPIKAIATIMYHSASYQSFKEGEVVDYTVVDCYEWIEYLGGMGSTEVVSFIKALTDSLSKDVPASKISAKDKKKG